MSAENPQHEFVFIQGIPVLPGGKPGLRKEFTKWATEKPEENIQVSLFIRALQLFYNEDYTKTLSYFQIAGIHGYPGTVAWDHSAEPTHKSRDEKQHFIYCTHNSLTFPTWHRPYMALFEQTIYQFMGKVIEQLHFSSEAEKNVWIKESTQWRLPYWDWALNTEVPDLFRPTTVKIRAPFGADGIQPEPEIVSNPLYRYELRVNGQVTKMGALPAPFTVDDVVFDGQRFPWSRCSGTSRWAIKSSEPDESQSLGINNYENIGIAIREHGYYDPFLKLKDPKNIKDLEHLDGPVGELRKHPVSDLVYRLLSNVKDWASFSSTITAQKEKPKDWEQWISLEYIHNNLHGFIGGFGGFNEGIGHMMNVPAAAFDPIFYMHHCNIDRLFAIWQVLHENSWFKDIRGPPATDSLTPFHHTQADYFDSNRARTWLNLGYQYDVLQRDDHETDDKYLERINAYVDKTYRSTGSVLLEDKGDLFQKNQDLASDEMYDDYMINVSYDRYGYKNGAPYTIHFLLEELSTHDTTTASDRSSPRPHRHVGSIFTFSSPVTSGEVHTAGHPRCGNCAQQLEEGVLSRASIPLTISLYKDATNQKIDGIRDLGPDNVEPYLCDRLTWVAKSVYVFKGKAKHYPKMGRLSVYQDYEPLPRVTHGKDAGASHEEY
ncbi:tyrosinase [Colletotrichum tabaci]|uniref:tyrosinase n=1 Tax=Colletotrichum tabaci TaxID=1209068 RepID=A0AAV9T8U9_9PEZI